MNSTAMSDHWYVQINATAHGPYTGTQMTELARQGQLNPTTLVARVGETTWTTWSEAGRLPDSVPAAWGPTGQTNSSTPASYSPPNSQFTGPPSPDPNNAVLPHQAQSYGTQPYPAQTYAAQPYQAQTYPAQTYPAQTYPAQPYPAQPYGTQPYGFAGQNPYGAPTSNAMNGYAPWRRSGEFVVPDGARIGDATCASCGGVATSEKKQNLSKTPTAALLLIFIGLIGMIIVAAITKRAKISYPLCEHCKARDPKRTKLGVMIVAAALLMMALAIAVIDSGKSTGLWVFGFIAAIAGVIVAAGKTQLFKVTNIQNGYATIMRNSSWKRDQQKVGLTP